MSMIYIQIVGCVIFALVTFLLAVWLKTHPKEKAAKMTSRILHVIGGLTYRLPLVIGIFYPGLSSYDTLIGIPSLPLRSFTVTLGVILLPIGIILLLVSTLVLRDEGQGQPLLFPTEVLVNKSIYKISRNPMALGFYSGFLALGLLSGSTYYTLLVLILVIPSHIFALKYFEELELELRFGRSYIEYKEHVPFLIPKFRNAVERRTVNSNA